MPEIVEPVGAGDEQSPAPAGESRIQVPITNGRIMWSPTTATTGQYYINTNMTVTSTSTYLTPSPWDTYHVNLEQVPHAPAPTEEVMLRRRREQEERERLQQERAERAREEQRRYQEERERPYTQASSERAIELIKSILEPDFRELFEQTGEIRCTGQSGIIYMVRNNRGLTWHDNQGGYVGNIFPMFKGAILGSYCCHLESTSWEGARINAWDQFAGQVLSLRFDEAEFMAKANRNNGAADPHIDGWIEASQAFVERQRLLKDAYFYNPDRRFPAEAARWVNNPPFRSASAQDTAGEVVGEARTETPRGGPYMIAV